jgi:hypothetical protein
MIFLSLNPSARQRPHVPRPKCPAVGLDALISGIQPTFPHDCLQAYPRFFIPRIWRLYPFQVRQRKVLVEATGQGLSPASRQNPTPWVTLSSHRFTNLRSIGSYPRRPLHPEKLLGDASSHHWIAADPPNPSSVSGLVIALSTFCLHADSGLVRACWAGCLPSLMRSALPCRAAERVPSSPYLQLPPRTSAVATALSNPLQAPTPASNSRAFRINV